MVEEAFGCVQEEGERGQVYVEMGTTSVPRAMSSRTKPEWRWCKVLVCESQTVNLDAHELARQEQSEHGSRRFESSSASRSSLSQLRMKCYREFSISLRSPQC